MEAAWLILFIAGGFLTLCGWFPALTALWKADGHLGFSSLMFPILPFIFAATNLDRLRISFWLQLCGSMLMLSGFAVRLAAA